MVRVLALETADQPGSVALLDEAQVSVEVGLPPDRRTTQTLLSVVDRCLHQVGWMPQDVELVAVCRGPGSFTGLRIGITVAKMWAYASGIPVVAVHTLQLLASQAARWTPPRGHLAAVMNAQRGQWFASLFEGAKVADQFDPDVSVAEPLAWLRGIGPDTLLTGPGLHLLAEDSSIIQPRSPIEVWGPRALELAKLAVRAHRAGRADDVWTVSPFYYRPSAAEEKKPTTQRSDSAHFR